VDHRQGRRKKAKPKTSKKGKHKATRKRKIPQTTVNASPKISAKPKTRDAARGVNSRLVSCIGTEQN